MAAAVLWAIVSLAVGAFDDVCGEQVADDSTVVEVCGPLAVTDLPVVAFLLVVALLLLPDLSEIEFAGVLSLRRAVSEVEGAATMLRGEVADLHATATAITNQQQAIHVNIGADRLADGVAKFRDDLDDEETGELTDDEELGGYASLAFNSAFEGLVPALFDQFSDVRILGWMRRSDDRWVVRYVVGDLEQTDDTLVEAIRADLTSATPPDGPFSTGETSAQAPMVMTSYAVLDALPAGGRDADRAARPGSPPLAGAVLGALTVLARTEDGDGWAGVTATLAAATDTAAGTYALLLNRLLGQTP